MAKVEKKVEEEIVGVVESVAKVTTTETGINPFTLIYEKMSSDGKNGTKVEVFTHATLSKIMKVTEIVNGNVSVSICELNGMGYDRVNNKITG